MSSTRRIGPLTPVGRSSVGSLGLGNATGPPAPVAGRSKPAKQRSSSA